MNLEIISKEPAGQTRPTPLLFVHGAYAGAWAWESHFLPFFAAHGYRAYALSLRGHGASEGRERLLFARLSDYVADVERVADTLPAPPVLVGHSLGGMVVQKIMHRRKHGVPAAVLMASSPPHGIIGSAVHMMLQHPRLFANLTLMQAFGPAFVDFALIRRALFSDDTPDHVFHAFAPRLDAESAAVVFDLWGWDVVPSSRLLDLPVLVLGAGNDPFIYPGAVAETAWTYRTRPVMFEGMGHAMMLDHHWERVARHILDWLEATLAGGGAAAARDAA